MTAGSVSVAHTTGLAEVSLPALTDAEDLVFVSNSSLTSLSVPALHSAFNLDVERNSLLSTMAMPVLQAVSNWLSIIDNPAYPQCRAEAILAQLTAVPANVTISGNDTTATCP